jgi:hypothetical protein
MKHSTLHTLVLVTGLITGLVHLVLLSVQLGELSVLFVLNGLGYLALLGGFFWNPPFLAGRRSLMHYLFISYAAVTILAWIPLGSRTLTGYVTKLDELVLIAALVAHLRSPSEVPAASGGQS